MANPIELADVLEQMAANVMFDIVRQNQLLEAARLLRENASTIAELRAAIETMRKYARTALVGCEAGECVESWKIVEALSGRGPKPCSEIAAALALRLPKESEEPHA